MVLPPAFSVRSCQINVSPGRLKTGLRCRLTVCRQTGDMPQNARQTNIHQPQKSSRPGSRKSSGKLRHIRPAADDGNAGKERRTFARGRNAGDPGDVCGDAGRDLPDPGGKHQAGGPEILAAGRRLSDRREARHTDRRYAEQVSLSRASRRQGEALRDRRRA